MKASVNGRSANARGPTNQRTFRSNHRRLEKSTVVRILSFTIQSVSGANAPTQHVHLTQGRPLGVVTIAKCEHSCQPATIIEQKNTLRFTERRGFAHTIIAPTATTTTAANREVVRVIDELCLSN